MNPITKEKWYLPLKQEGHLVGVLQECEAHDEKVESPKCVDHAQFDGQHFVHVVVR
jgi:hypothetical protein